MSKSILRILLAPILSEKSVILRDKENRYGFKVDPTANKIEIKHAVETVFKVKVEKVRTLNVHGKMHRVGKYQGMRSDWKKAFVTVKEGQKIDLTSLPK
jgi:large subunit ribosomal protein L23